MYRLILRTRSGTKVKTPRATRSRSSLPNQSSTWLSLGVCWCEVELDARVFVKKLVDQAGFVR